MRTGGIWILTGLWMWGGISLQAAPITFDTALPVHEGGFLLRVKGFWVRMGNDPSPLGREMDVTATPVVMVYGATPRLALMGVLPYVDKELRVASAGVTRQAGGLGDIFTVARYEIFQRNRVGATSRGALFAGLEWPTGDAERSDSLGRLPRPVQPGSGSYDALLGTVWTWQRWAWQMDADALYRENTRHEDFAFGDVLRQDVSLQYRLWHGHLGKGSVPSYLYGVLEANSLYQTKNKVGGTRDPDSGGYQLFLTPGLQWVTNRVVWELAWQRPVAQNLNGDALESEYQITAGVRWWF